VRTSLTASDDLRFVGAILAPPLVEVPGEIVIDTVCQSG
jgi:hypothetical protein